MKKLKTGEKLFCAWIIVSLLFCVGVFLHSVFMQRGLHTHFTAAASMLAAIAMGNYMFKGHKKDAAKELKVALLLCAAAEFYATIPMILKGEVLGHNDLVAILSCFVISDIYLVLALVPDLGKKKSLTLSGFVALDGILTFIVLAFMHPGSFINVAAPTAQTMENARLGALVVLAICVFICEYYKYKDKAERHTF